MTTSPSIPLHRDLNVTVLGTGVPLVTLHGGLGFDHTSFRPWLDALADSCQLVYFDHRGNGQAVDPTDWAQVTHDSLVDDLESLRISLEAEQMVLLGHSYGGFLALEYTIRHPDRVAGLVLCNTGPTYRHLETIVENVRRRATPEAFAAIMQWLAAPAVDDAALSAGIQPLLPLYLHRDAEPMLVQEVFGRTTFRAAAFNHALTQLAPAYDVTDALHTLAVPTLVIAGDDDIIFPGPYGPDVLMAQLPQATLATFPGTGHYPFAEAPELFVRTMREWLAQHVR